MNKSTFFTGQPIFSQLIRLIPKREVDRIARGCGSNRYYKKFDTWHHLMTMLYCSYQHCTSLREITTGMSACEGRLQSLNVRHFTRKSTFSDANKRRDAQVFEGIYQMLYARLSPYLPDSRLKGSVFKKLAIIDSTSISLFNDIYKGPGRNPVNGKKKGGLKVHMAVRAKDDVPCLVRITSAASHDSLFAKAMQLAKGSYVVFDKGYHSHKLYEQFDKNGVSWVTRSRYNSVIKVIKGLEVDESEYRSGVRKDEQIIMGHPNKNILKVKCRRIKYFDSINRRTFEFITNNNRIKASTVAAIYKQRWQIEILFKRLKQNMPLQYFLGDNENAIQIQIWCTLIADLLLKVSTKGIKRTWAFSNLSSLIRLHLMNYTDLKKFLNNPDKARISMPEREHTQQLELFAPNKGACF
jgi:Transposase DDE domain/Domain of unknown function (DUF4372)